jgi:hypothetical protein
VVLVVWAGTITSLTVVLLGSIKNLFFGCGFEGTCVLSNVRRGSGRPIVALVPTSLTLQSEVEEEPMYNVGELRTMVLHALCAADEELVCNEVQLTLVVPLLFVIGPP